MKILILDSECWGYRCTPAPIVSYEAKIWGVPFFLTVSLFFFLPSSLPSSLSLSLSLPSFLSLSVFFCLSFLLSFGLFLSSSLSFFCSFFPSSHLSVSFLCISVFACLFFLLSFVLPFPDFISLPSFLSVCLSVLRPYLYFIP